MTIDVDYELNWNKVCFDGFHPESSRGLLTERWTLFVFPSFKPTGFRNAEREKKMRDIFIFNAA